MPTPSVAFFESQFQRQVTSGAFELNPFERLALPYLGGELLDLGCGLGNLALAAARAGCRVTALDGSPTGIARLLETAANLALPVAADEADLGHWACGQAYDSIAAIGLLMFFPRTRAEALLADIVAHVRPGGVVALNVLIEGTTFLGMFAPDHYHLFAPGTLLAAVPGWEVLAESRDCFPAPGETVKVFETVIARKPCAA
jgi:tellurite methyltransferase